MFCEFLFIVILDVGSDESFPEIQSAKKEKIPAFAWLGIIENIEKTNTTQINHFEIMALNIDFMD